MNFIKRAFLNVTKNIKKTILLFIIMFVIGNLVLIGFSINNAASTSIEVARKSLGATVSLKFNQKAVMQAQREGLDIEYDAVSEDMADNISESEYVIGHNYSYIQQVTADNFEAVDTSGGNVSTGAPRLMNESYDAAELTLEGVIATDMTKNFVEETDNIVEGEGINSENSDKNVCVIEKSLSDQNELKIGDKIVVQALDQSTKEEFEIVGIYETMDMESSEMPSAMSPYNKIYIPYDKAKLLTPSDVEITDEIKEATYYLNDALNIDKFKEEVINKGIDEEVYNLDANDTAFQQMVGPMESVSSLANNVVYVVIIAGGTILALIIMFTMRERNYELGVLLSLGEMKLKIILQLFLEILLIGIISFTLSTVTSKFIAQNVANQIISNQIETSVSENSMPNTFNRPGSGVNESIEPIADIDISIGNEELQKVGQVAMAIISTSILIPAVRIFTTSPKSILSKYE